MLSILDFPNHLIRDAVDRALAEDLGLAGDITTNAIVVPGATSHASIVAREAGSIAGLPLCAAVFLTLDPAIAVGTHVEDGAVVTGGAVLARVSGPSRGILSGERAALNYLQHLSGIASMTRRFCDAVAGTGAKIVCTRKTTPGLRALQKYAVRAGGGVNHRFGLFDAVLIKDNHIAAAGGIAQAIQRARASLGHLVKIEVEVDTLTQLAEVLPHDVDAVLLDNMTVSDLAQGVATARAARPGLVCEASGGVRIETVRAIAETGVDLISVGALTHSPVSLDIGLDWHVG